MSGESTNQNNFGIELKKFISSERFTKKLVLVAPEQTNERVIDYVGGLVHTVEERKKIKKLSISEGDDYINKIVLFPNATLENSRFYIYNEQQQATETTIQITKDNKTKYKWINSSIFEVNKQMSGPFDPIIGDQMGHGISVFIFDVEEKEVNDILLEMTDNFGEYVNKRIDDISQDKLFEKVKSNTETEQWEYYPQLGTSRQNKIMVSYKKKINSNDYEFVLVVESGFEYESSKFVDVVNEKYSTIEQVVRSSEYFELILKNRIHRGSIALFAASKLGLTVRNERIISKQFGTGGHVVKYLLPDIENVLGSITEVGEVCRIYNGVHNTETNKEGTIFFDEVFMTIHLFGDVKTNRTKRMEGEWSNPKYLSGFPSDLGISPEVNLSKIDTLKPVYHEKGSNLWVQSIGELTSQTIVPTNLFKSEENKYIFNRKVYCYERSPFSFNLNRCCGVGDTNLIHQVCSMLARKPSSLIDHTIEISEKIYPVYHVRWSSPGHREISNEALIKLHDKKHEFVVLRTTSEEFKKVISGFDSAVEKLEKEGVKTITNWSELLGNYIIIDAPRSFVEVPRTIYDEVMRTIQNIF
jgi:hypothetical protein